MSEKWNGDAKQWPEFKILIKGLLFVDGNALIIIPEGEQGHIPDVPLPMEPPNFDPHTGVPRSQYDMSQWRRECDRIKSDAMKNEEKAQKALATILQNIGLDAIQAIKHIRDDEDNSYKQKCQWIMGALQNAFCGNNDHTRVELTRGIDEIAGIDTRHDATHAITIIDDVNAELERHINLRTGELGYYRQSDETKMNKYIELLEAGTSGLFSNSIDYLTREKNGSRLTWPLLKAEMETRCRELMLREKNVTLKKGGTINQVSSAGKSFEDGVEEGMRRKATHSDRGDVRDRSQDRNRSRDRSFDRGNGRDNYRSGRQDGFDRNYDGRRSQEDNRWASNGSSRDDRRSESRDRGGRYERGREDRRRSDSPAHFRRDDTPRRNYEDSARSGRDYRGRSGSVGSDDGKESEDAKIKRLEAELERMKKAQGSKESKGKTKH